MTEGEVVAAIERSANILAPKYVFGHYDLEDIKQECFVFGMQLMSSGKYDPSRPLDNYLYIHIRNRLINLKRNAFRRTDPPCPQCHAGPPYCTATGDCCKVYSAWFVRNRSKSSLASPVGLELASEQTFSSRPDEAQESAELSEALRMIDEHLPIELRQYYLQMRDGVAVPKARRQQVEAAVKEILSEWQSPDD